MTASRPTAFVAAAITLVAGWLSLPPTPTSAAITVSIRPDTVDCAQAHLTFGLCRITISIGSGFGGSGGTDPDPTPVGRSRSPLEPSPGTGSGGGSAPPHHGPAVGSPRDPDPQIGSHQVTARFALPGAKVEVDPPNGRTLVDLPTNLYTNAADTVEVELLVGGELIRLRATPERYEWQPDPALPTRTTAGPGSPWPNVESDHLFTYDRAGRYPVSVTVHYRVEWWHPAIGEWRVIDQTIASADNPTRSLTVVDLRTTLGRSPSGRPAGDRPAGTRQW